MKPATVASLALALLAPLAVPQSAGPEGDRGATVQDVEVLRRLLVESVGEAARPPQEAAAQQGWPAFTVPQGQVTGAPLVTYDAYTGWFGRSEPVPRARGFHLPGQGVLLTLDVRVPARRAPARSADDPAAADEDLDEWERVRRELEGGQRTAHEAQDEAAQGEYAGALAIYRDAGLVQGLRSWSAGDWELDHDALARVERAVLDTLERHGARVRGLQGDEGLTVALHVSAASRAFAPSSSEGSDATLGYWNLAIAGNAAQQVPARHVVVHVRRAQLDGLRPGELAGRAQVHSY